MIRLWNSTVDTGFYFSYNFTALTSKGDVFMPTTKQDKEATYPLKVTVDMPIGEVMQLHPAFPGFLLEKGVHCVGCGIAFFETLGDGLAGHGFYDEEIAAIIEEMNAFLSVPPDNSEE